MHILLTFRSVLLFLVAASASVSIAQAADKACVVQGKWYDVASNEFRSQDKLIDSMARQGIVLLGESHTRKAHHRWQLHSLAALHGQNPNLIIGFEAFPADIQPILDRWVQGGMSEQDFLTETRWNEVWSYDSSLYMPLFHFAREHRVPIVGINVRSALIKGISAKGWQAIPKEERQGVSDPAPALSDYIDVLAKVYASHREKDTNDEEQVHVDKSDPQFQRFVEAQLVWDRAMAENLARARRAGGNPLVVGIVGQGHLEYGYGIPHQLKSLGISDVSSLLPRDADEDCEELTNKGAPIAQAVFGLDAPAKSAPTSDKPKLGIFIETAEEGVLIKSVVPDSVAEATGLAKDDVIIMAAGQAVTTSAGLVNIIQGLTPGLWLPLQIRRGGETQSIIAKFPPRPSPQP